MFRNVQNIRIGPANRSLFVLRRIASPNVVSIRVSSYCFVSHRCTFVSISVGVFLSSPCISFTVVKDETICEPFYGCAPTLVSFSTQFT